MTRDGSIKSSSDKVFEVRDVGKYKYISVKDNGISLLWDKGTILYVKLGMTECRLCTALQSFPLVPTPGRRSWLKVGPKVAKLWLESG